MQPKTSIRSKITLPYLFLSVITAISIGVVTVKVILENVDERFNNQLFETGTIASVQMAREEDRLLETLRMIANAEGLDQAVLEEDADKLRDTILGIVINNQEEIIDILDMDGNLLLSMRHKPGGNVEEYEYLQGGLSVYRNWPFVTSVLNGEVDEQGNKFSGIVKTGWGNYFYVSGPIFDEDRTQIGAVLVGKTLGTLVQEIRAKTLGQITLYAKSGQVLSSTFLAPQTISEALAQETLAIQDEQSYRRNPPRREQDFEGLQYSELLGPWEVRGKTDIGIIGVSLVQNALITTTIATRVAIVALMSLIILFIIVIGVGLARIITSPILALVSASKEVAQGNLRIQVDPTTDDEIALLTHNFNSMVSSLDKSQQDLVNAYDSTLEGWSQALELKDSETEGHTQRVTNLTVEFARSYGIQENEIVHIRRGAILHDIGKMGVPDEILLKPGALTEAEWEIMRQHPVNAYNMLRKIEYLTQALDIPYSHHEKWDGTGYPRGLKGEEIPLAARLFSIVDAWDAMTSTRPYRKGMSEPLTQQTIVAEKGTRFDPELVDFFMQFLREKMKSNKR